LPPSEPKKAANGQPISAPLSSSDMDGFAQHRCAFDANNVFCWGANSLHQVDGAQDPPDDDADEARPVAFVAANTPNPTHRTIAAGGTFTIALDSLGQIGCWGDNGGKQCTSNGHTPLEFPDGNFDLIAVNPDNPPARFVTLSAAEGSACAIGSDTELYCWGDSPSGEVGQGAGAADQDYATTVVSQ
jgi:alpha-tubulin suppressor-like RCC1 family protein